MGVGRARNLDDTTRSVDRRFETGLSFTVSAPFFPDVSQSVDYTRVNTEFQFDGSRGTLESFSVNGIFDFTKFLPDLLLKRDTYLSLNYLFQNTYSNYPDFGKDQQDNYSVGIATGFRF